MKWLFTGPLPEIEELVRLKGDTVVSQEDVWFDNFIDPEEPESGSYRLTLILAEHVVEVCVLVNPSTPPGIKKSHAVKWSRYGSHKTLVGWSTTDPENIHNIKLGKLTRCKCKPRNYDLYVTNDSESAVLAAKQTVCILYDQNFDLVYQTILLARLSPKEYKYHQRLHI